MTKLKDMYISYERDKYEITLYANEDSTYLVTVEWRDKCECCGRQTKWKQVASENIGAVETIWEALTKMQAVEEKAMLLEQEASQ